MINYRIYVSSRRVYHCFGTYNPEETIVFLDYMILEKQTNNKILAIECDTVNNSEFPIFLYLGKQEEYDEFKEYLNVRKEIEFQKRRKR